jgi:outer membrane protein OmpA-like peptidoglycan-associated protein
MQRFLIILFTICSVSSIAQSAAYHTTSKRAEKFYSEGLTFYDANDYKKAIQSFKKSIFEDKEFVEAWLLLGEIYEQINLRDSAAVAYLKAIEINPDIHPYALMNLAEIEYKQGKYKDAEQHLTMFSKYPANQNNKTRRLNIIRLEKKLETALRLMNNPVPFAPVNLGDSINTAFAEYFPTITADGGEMIITRRIEKPVTTIDGNAVEEEEDFYISYFNVDSGYWSMAKPMPEPVNTSGNEGTQSISPDGKYLYFTGCNRKDGFGNCDIYFSKKVGGKWQTPHNLWEPINTAYWESQPSIAPDGRTLFFASTRPEGSRGGSDIWVSYLDDNGIWSEPENLGDSINTPGNESSPFIHYDGQTLYFSSDGHDGMGGKDLFYSKRKKNGTWTTPQNLGYPINTHKDEISLIVAADGKTAYYASDREDSKGKLDIYQFDLHRDVRSQPVSYIKGRLFDASKQMPIEGKFEIINLSTGETVAGASSDPQTGDFLVTLPVEEQYAINVSKDGYMFYSENFEVGSISDQIKPVNVDISLKDIEVGASVVMNNIFFEIDKSELKQESIVELKKIIELLNKNKKVKIEISGHTDNTGSQTRNQQLSELRAKAIYDYLIENKINPNRLTYKGYASQKPIESNDTDDGRAKNRRTEITIIEN